MHLRGRRRQPCALNPFNPLDFAHRFRYVINITYTKGTKRILSRLATATHRLLQSRYSRLVLTLLASMLLLAESALNDIALGADTSWASTPPLRMVVHKARQVLALYEGARLVKTYRVCLGLEPVGAKIETGDRRTPEGEYFICSKSSHHRLVGYPTGSFRFICFENCY